MDSQISPIAPKGKTAIVTGGTGLIGQWLTLSLIKKGYRVLLLLRRPVQQVADMKHWLANKGIQDAPIAGQHFDLLDPKIDAKQETAHLWKEASVIYNLAARFAFGLSPEEAYRANVQSTLELYKQSARWPKLKSFIQVTGYRSKGQVWKQQGFESEALTQKLYLKHGAYEASKIHANWALLKAAKHSSLPVTVVSPSGIIGHSASGETNQITGIGEFAMQLQRGRLPALPSSAQTWLPLVSVDFVAEFMARLPEQPGIANQNYVLLHPDTPLLPELIKRMASMLGVKAPWLRLPPWLVRTLPQKMSGAHPESLSFLVNDRYDLDNSLAMAETMRLPLPDFDTNLKNWLSFMQNTQFLGTLPTST